eukprot:PhM_4_TR8306/c2_g1_i2/m.25031
MSCSPEWLREIQALRFRAPCGSFAHGTALARHDPKVHGVISSPLSHKRRSLRIAPGLNFCLGRLRRVLPWVHDTCATLKGQHRRCRSRARSAFSSRRPVWAALIFPHSRSSAKSTIQLPVLVQLFIRSPRRYSRHLYVPHSDSFTHPAHRLWIFRTASVVRGRRRTGAVYWGQTVTHRGVVLDFEKKTTGIRDATTLKIQQKWDMPDTWGKWRSIIGTQIYTQMGTGRPRANLYHLIKWYARNALKHPNKLATPWTQAALEMISAKRNNNNTYTVRNPTLPGSIIFTDAATSTNRSSRPSTSITTTGCC